MDSSTFDLFLELFFGLTSELDELDFLWSRFGGGRRGRAAVEFEVTISKTDESIALI